MGDIELHKLLLSHDIQGVNVKDIDKKTGAKIKRGYKCYDEADVVYHELFRRDENEVLMKVIKDKDENFKRKKDRNAQLEDAIDYLEDRNETKGLMNKKLFSRKQSASTNFNRGSSLAKLRLSTDVTEENRFL